MMAVYEKKYVWSVLLRIFHWAFALSIFTLIVTGLYINWPWTNTWMEGSHQFTMATMRWIHFIAGMIFICAVILRLYLWFFGNKYERLTDFLPINGRNIKNLFSTLLYYAYLTNEHEERAGHNALAGTAYFFTIILAIIQAIRDFTSSILKTASSFPSALSLEFNRRQGSFTTLLTGTLLGLYSFTFTL